MKKVQTLISVVLTAAVLLSCVTQPAGEPIIPGIDRVIEKTAQGILADLPQEQARTLAVYYFTVGGEVSSSGPI